MKRKKGMFARIKDNLRKGSVFRKYFSSTAIVVFGCMVSLGILMMIVTAGKWWDEKVEILTDNTNEIAALINDFSKEDDQYSYEEKEMILKINLEVMSHATNSDYFVTDSSGKIVMCEYNLPSSDVETCNYHKGTIIPEKYMERAKNNGFSDYTTDDVFGLGKFVVAIPLNKSTEYSVVFAVEDAITGLFPYILNIFQTFSISILAVIAICFIVIYFFCRGITTPISEMQEVTAHFAKGEFEHRACEEYSDEYLRSFAKALNKMADELAAEEESQRSFVANVSHELKTPMTSISGFIDGILDGTIPPEKEKEYLTRVSSEVKRLSRMVVSMLNLSKIEVGKLKITPFKYDVSSQIFDTLLLFEKTINEKNIQISGLDRMSGVNIKADRDLLKQVIFNLFDNAVKFTPENGVITVSAKIDDGKTKVSIKNSGKGISEQERQHIFERFYKTDKSRSYDTKGVGLGLYIVKTIINMHDGEIEVTSVPDEYTCFSFEIPY